MVNRKETMVIPTERDVVIPTERYMVIPTERDVIIPTEGDMVVPTERDIRHFRDFGKYRCVEASAFFWGLREPAYHFDAALEYVLLAGPFVMISFLVLSVRPRT